MLAATAAAVLARLRLAKGWLATNASPGVDLRSTLLTLGILKASFRLLSLTRNVNCYLVNC